MDAPQWGVPPPLKNEVPQLKNNPLPLKSEAPFQEMIPKKIHKNSTRTRFSHLEHSKFCNKGGTVCFKALYYLIN